MLCRLNQELLPDPGSPMARITVPFSGRAAAVAGACPVDGVSIVEATTDALLSVGGSLKSALDEAIPGLCGSPLPRPPLARRRLRRGVPLPVGS